MSKVRQRWVSLVLALIAAVGMLVGLSGCGRYHGPLTNLGSVDQFLPALWNTDPTLNQVAVNSGVYPMPARHLILVHVQIPDASVASLGLGAVHGAVGVWWIALDDRMPGAGGKVVWVASCGLFKAQGSGAAFDLAGDFLYGPAAANLSRYPLSFNPEDSSVSVALSPQDEIAIARDAMATPYLPPKSHTCSASA